MVSPFFSARVSAGQSVAAVFPRPVGACASNCPPDSMVSCTACTSLACSGRILSCAKSISMTHCRLIYLISICAGK